MLCVALGILSCWPAVGPALALDDYVLALVARLVGAHGEVARPETEEQKERRNDGAALVRLDRRHPRQEPRQRPLLPIHDPQFEED